MESSNNKSLALMAVGSAASLVGVYLLYCHVHAQPQVTRRNEDDDDKTNTSKSKQAPCPSDMTPLPPHIQRELYKEQRRKKSVRFLALKKPMYDNIEMYGPDGIMLCTIGKKKANWYVNKKGLAVWSDRW